MPAAPALPASRRDLVAVARALVLLAALACAAPARAQPSPLLQGHESVATADGALGTIWNPALIGLRYPSELLLAGSWDQHGDDRRHDALFAWRSLGLRYTRWPDLAQTYGFTLAAGDPAFRLGWSAEWTGPDLATPEGSDHRVGFVARSSPGLSLGGTVDHLFQPRRGGVTRERDYRLGAALRPLGLPFFAAGASPHDATRFTVFAEARAGERQLGRSDRLKPDWRAGIELEPIAGIALRYAHDGREDTGNSFGVVLRLPRLAFAGKTTDVEHPREAGSVALPGLSSTWSLSLHSAEDLTRLVPPGARRVGEMRISGGLADDDLSGFSLLGGPEGTTPVKPLHERLEFALHDRLTRGVLLELGGAGNMAAIEELRPRIQRLRAAGKPVVAYLEEGGSRGDLMLASACDRIVASEEALFWSLGLRVERRYYRRFLDELGVKVDRSSIGKYKSAYRNYSVDSTPPADRESIEHLLDRSQEMFVGTVAEARRMERARLETLLDGRQWSSEDLLRAGLIDSVGYREQALRMLGRLTGGGHSPRSVRLAEVERAQPEWAPARGIAIVYASGGIETGVSGNDLWEGATLGATTLVRQIEDAFHRSDVRAVVFRIESPGGSVLASDLIYHALMRMKAETHKPLIVSMGSVAASGGYAIAIPGQRIFADRQTRTGSIGVLFTHPSLERFYAKHEVRQDEFERGRYMRGQSFNRDWDAEIQASADSAIARTYDRFVTRVALARGLPLERVYEIAQGRVWLGQEARDMGLVDEIGGLEQAVAFARRAAGLPAAAQVEPIEYRRPRPSLLQRVAGGWVRAAIARSARSPLTPDLRYEAGADVDF